MAARAHAEDDDLATSRLGAAPAPDFVLDLLRELRAGNYLPPAWGRFLWRSWGVSRATAREHPRLAASWRRHAAGLALAAAAALGLEAAAGGAEGRHAARGAAPAAALCLGYTLFDGYVHLALNRCARGEPLHETLGVPSTLTLARGTVAALLFAHLCARTAATKPAVIAALGIAIVTDIADGTLARATGRTTRLGAYLDGEVDFGFGIALWLTLAARRLLPAWLVALSLVRWMGPLVYALGSYFGWANRIDIGSTVTGKAAGVAQAATVGVALLPARFTARVPRLRTALHVATAALLLAAPLMQLRKVVRGRAER
ncbi:MAG: CDP-alcohol phosphatidyltransferase family protein [Ktedonobacterales bacterium]